MLSKKTIIGIALGSVAAAIVIIVVIVLCTVLIPKSTEVPPPDSTSSSEIVSENDVLVNGSVNTDLLQGESPTDNSASGVKTDLLQGEYIPEYYYDLGIVEDFWGQNYYGQGVKVLVIDSGANKSHPDLQTVHETNTNEEEDVHGTHVCGIIGGDINGIGMVGIAPLCDVYIWDMGSGYDNEITPAFDWAVENGMQVINMSFGSDWDDSYFHSQVQKCRNAGIFLIAAAGNESSDTLIYPAAYDECIAVVSVDANGELSWFTNFDPATADVCAYGVNIKSDNAEFSGSSDLLLDLSGTSMSTPFVTGLCALIIQRETENGNTSISNNQMIEFLKAYLPTMPS